jgi:nucleoid-associated protein YgaU
MAAYYSDMDGFTGGSSAEGESAKTYTVQKGDSLSKIAKEFYGDANKWKKIYEANKDRIKNPDVIQIGWELVIPD